MHGVSFRINLNIDSTRFAGVDSSQSSNVVTMQFCNLFISLKDKEETIRKKEKKEEKKPMKIKFTI